MSSDQTIDKLMSAVWAIVAAAEDKDYNSQDTKFVRDMIPHHEMAIEMAEKQIDKGKNRETVDLAKEIKKNQTAEVEQLRAWLEDRDLKEDGGGM